MPCKITMPYGILYLAAYSRTRGQRRYRARRHCVPQPEAIPTTDMIMVIGSPAYIVDGYDLTVTCNDTSKIGKPPVNISWYRNGSGVLDTFISNV